MLPHDSPLHAIDAASDWLIAFAYFTIPIQILYFIKHNPSPIPPSLRSTVILVLFSSFIALCGLTHLVNVLYYDDWTWWAECLMTVKLLCCIISLITAAVLIHFIPQFLAFCHSAQQLKVVNELKVKELDQSHQEILKINRAKDEFISVLAHEIRTPLHIITSNIDFLLETPLNVEQADYVRSVNDSAELMVSIVNDILDMSRLEAGRMSFEKIPIDLYYITRTLINNTQQQARFKHLNLKFQYHPSCPHYIIGDPTRIHQLLLNLVSNAIKFTSSTNGAKGEVTLNVWSSLTKPEFWDEYERGSQLLPNNVVKRYSHLINIDVDSEKIIQRDEEIQKMKNVGNINDNDSNDSESSTASLIHNSEHSISLNNDNNSIQSDSDVYDELITDYESFSSSSNPRRVSRSNSISDLDLSSTPAINKNKSRRQFRYIYFQVTDTGAGINSKTLPLLFSPFTQASLSTARESGGSGLGLSIVHQLVSNLRGHIIVKSEVGKGSVFTLVLEMPISSAAEVQKVQAHKLGKLPQTIHKSINHNENGDHYKNTNNESNVFHTVNNNVLNSSSSSLDSSNIIPLNLITPLTAASNSSTAAKLIEATLSPRSMRMRRLANIQDLSIISENNSTKSPNQLPPLNTSSSFTDQSSITINSQISSQPVHHVLVTDDNEVNRKIMARILGSLGYKVSLAADGEEAIKAVQSQSLIHPFSCVFMDLNMPIKNGYDATREIRSLGFDVQIIALTAMALHEERQKCQEAGFNEFCSKPARKAELVKLLARVINQSVTTPSESNSSSPHSFFKPLNMQHIHTVNSIMPASPIIANNYRSLTAPAGTIKILNNNHYNNNSSPSINSSTAASTHSSPLSRLHKRHLAHSTHVNNVHPSPDASNISSYSSSTVHYLSSAPNSLASPLTATTIPNDANFFTSLASPISVEQHGRIQTEPNNNNNSLIEMNNKHSDGLALPDALTFANSLTSPHALKLASINNNNSSASTANSIFPPLNN